MFTSAGSIMVKIDDVRFAESKFGKGPSDFDICIHGTSVADTNQGDYWRGEMSQNYGKGNFASMTQAQITMKTLRAIGFEGDDLTTLAAQLIGKSVPFNVKASEPNEDGKVFYNVKFIETTQPIAEIDAATVNARVKALFAGGGTAPAQAAATPATTPTQHNPFAKKATGSTAAATVKSEKLPF